MTSESDEKPGPLKPKREPYEYDLENEARALEDLKILIGEFLIGFDQLIKAHGKNEDFHPETLRMMNQVEKFAEAYLTKRVIPRMETVRKDIDLFIGPAPKTGVELEDVDADEPPTPLPSQPPPPPKPPKKPNKPNNGRKK